MEGQTEVFRTPGYSFLLLPAVAFHHVAFIGLLESFLLATFSAWLVWKISLVSSAIQRRHCGQFFLLF